MGFGKKNSSSSGLPPVAPVKAAPVPPKPEKAKEPVPSPVPERIESHLHVEQIEHDTSIEMMEEDAVGRSSGSSDSADDAGNSRKISIDADFLENVEEEVHVTAAAEV